MNLNWINITTKQIKADIRGTSSFQLTINIDHEDDGSINSVDYIVSQPGELIPSSSMDIIFAHHTTLLADLCKQNTDFDLQPYLDRWSQAGDVEQYSGVSRGADGAESSWRNI